VPERAESLAGVIEPVLRSLGLELFDVELTGSGSARTLRVLVDRDGGVDLEAITAATEAISPVLDRLDEPSLRGPYGLEVSSPGLERPLRRPEHFRRSLGATVSVKTRAADGHTRRLRGELIAADDDGFTIESEGAPEQVAYDAVTQARTVFEWGQSVSAAPKPGKGAKRKRPNKKKEAARS
jgi:ribosome maturation factor RimP